MSPDAVGQIQSQSFYEIQPDELFAGFMARCEFASTEPTSFKPTFEFLRSFTYLRNKKLCWQYWPESPIISSLNLPPNITNQIILSNSQASLFRPTTAPHIFEALLARYNGSGAEHSFVKERLPLSPIQYCPACLEEQISKIGFGYYRRVWALPFATMCRTHDLKLIPAYWRCCRYRPSTAESIFRPWQPNCPKCGDFGWIQETSITPEHSLNAQAWFEALTAADLPHFSTDLQRACLDEADSRIQRGKSNSGSYHLLDQLAMDFAYLHGLRRDAPVFTASRSGISATLGFWSVMITTFISFSEFKAWLDINSMLVRTSAASSNARVTQLDTRKQY